MPGLLRLAPTTGVITQQIMQPLLPQQHIPASRDQVAIAAAERGAANRTLAVAVALDAPMLAVLDASAFIATAITRAGSFWVTSAAVAISRTT
jgi:hypothetical protein